MSHWVECSVEVAGEHAEAITNFLFEQGSGGLQEEERDGRVKVTAYFESQAPIAELQRYADAIGADASNLAVRDVDMQDWAESWRDHFTPLSVGSRLFIVPPWINDRPEDRFTIVIDPGMAFGTGQHATTRMCLELSESILAKKPIRRAIDLGSGSGILAIGLAKLGVKQVRAIDNDPIALEATASNAESNAVGASITTASGLGPDDTGLDLLVANLFANLLVELAPTMAERVAAGGALVCSGFIDIDAERVEAALSQAGFRRLQRKEENPWVALAFERS